MGVRRLFFSVSMPLLLTKLQCVTIVKAELFFGAMKSHDPVQTLAGQQAFLAHFVSLPFDDSVTLAYGRIRAELTLIGRPIGANDYMIAAIALVHNLILVTHNTAEFSRVNGLRLEDWENP